MGFVIPFPDIDPALFSIEIGTFTFALRWYALAYIVGILIGWWILRAAIDRPHLWRDQPPMTKEQTGDLVTYLVIGIIIGGRLGFVLFYQPAYYLANPSEILFVWQGGMSFHGGMLGVVLALVLFSRRASVPLMSMADGLAVATPPGLFLGRIANFINGELWGRQTDLPWGVVFPGVRAQDCPQVEGLCARHPSQLYEAGLEGLLLGLLLFWFAFYRGGLRVPGQMTGLFLAGYGAARFFVEFFRQPDAQFVTFENPMGYAIAMGEVGLTMGQLLSLPMLIVGLLIVYAARKLAQRRTPE